MEAIDILMSEHRQIERVLGALRDAVERARRGETLPVAGFEAATQFIRGCADLRHHQKEEHILFEAMAKAGMPKEGGPIGVMLREHEEGRRLVAQMRGAVESLRGGESAETETLLEAVERYAALLAQHIEKEDQILYPMSMQMLTPGTFDDMARQFREVESGARRSFEEVAGEVVQVLGPISGEE